MWLLTNKTEPVYKEMFDRAISEGFRRMLRQSKSGNYTFLGSIGPTGLFVPEMEHLVRAVV